MRKFIKLQSIKFEENNNKENITRSKSAFQSDTILKDILIFKKFDGNLNLHKSSKSCDNAEMRNSTNKNKFFLNIHTNEKNNKFFQKTTLKKTTPFVLHQKQYEAKQINKNSKPKNNFHFRKFKKNRLSEKSDTTSIKEQQTPELGKNKQNNQLEIVFSKEKQEQNLQIDFNNKSLKLSKPVFRNNSFHKSKTFQEEYQTQFFPSVSKIKKSLTKPNISISGSFSKYSQNQNLQLKNKSFDEIQSPSKLVEKIYTNMNSNCKEGEKSNSLIKPKKIEYSIDSTTKKDKIISKGTMPGKKELRNCKYSNLKKKFIKEYFYPKEENQGSEKKEEICTNHFDQVIFNDLSAAALASHKWRKKTAQNNAYLMKSFSPEIIDYPNSPKFSQYNAFIRNFGRVQNSHKHCISNQVENKQLINNSSEIKTPNEQYLKQISQKEKEYQKVYGMNFNEYEDVIKLWEIDHLKSELPNIGQAYQYMKIIKSNNASKQISNKNKTKTPSKKKDLSSEKKIFVISPKTTNRSGLNLKPKKDILEVNNISSPTDKINHHTFFSPNSFKKRSPRFSIRSSNRYLTKSIEPSKCEQIEFSSFQFL